MPDPLQQQLAPAASAPGCEQRALAHAAAIDQRCTAATLLPQQPQPLYKGLACCCKPCLQCCGRTPTCPCCTFATTVLKQDQQLSSSLLPCLLLHCTAAAAAAAAARAEAHHRCLLPAAAALLLLASAAALPAHTSCPSIPVVGLASSHAALQLSRQQLQQVR
jgi:hypothetical protein